MKKKCEPKPSYFHHPDYCPTVIRRRLAGELLEMAFTTLEVLATRGRSLTWNHSAPNNNAYHCAAYRLRKQGLIAYRRDGGKNPVLQLTETGRKQLPDYYRPERFWNKKWPGIWYVLVYDVPEKERYYRFSLREFLKKKRMGCLQGSVWITPEDIRPEYSDLVDAGGLDNYAFLFESRTVLGQRPEAVVRTAWDMDRLHAVQRWFCDACDEHLETIRKGGMTFQNLTALMREGMMAYEKAMENDPLLPRHLWPSDYLGPQAHDQHLRFQREIANKM